MTHDNCNPWLKSAVLMALVSGLLMILGGYLIYRDTHDRRQHQIEHELELVNRLQRQNLKTWRDARLAEAAAITGDSLLGYAVADWRQASQAHRADASILRIPIQEKLRLLREQASYDAVYLLDPMGSFLLSQEGRATISLPPGEQQALRQAWSQARPIPVEPRYDPAFAFPFFSLIVPVYQDDNPVAAVWMVLDVRKSLYPLLEKWPSPNQTGESVIVIRNNEAVRILSPLRERTGTTPLTHIPFAHSQDVMVQAVQGMRGLFMATDYRDQSVIAVASPVAGSPWYLISKIDTDEALTSHWQDILRIAAPIAVGLLCIWLILVYAQHQIWRREHVLKQQLEQQVRHDPLTQLANRLALDERFEINWHQAIRHQRPLSALMVDVDYFKAYNDHFGHIAGDLCLKNIANIISSVICRKADLVSRYGGEEFVVLLPDTRAEQAMGLAEQICAAVHDAAIEHPFARHDQRITVSVGVTCMEPPSRNEQRDFILIKETLLERADLALYAAKRAGRNQVSLSVG